MDRTSAVWLEKFNGVLIAKRREPNRFSKGERRVRRTAF
jgi:hypothetical protein